MLLTTIKTYIMLLPTMNETFHGSRQEGITAIERCRKPVVGAFHSGVIGAGEAGSAAQRGGGAGAAGLVGWWFYALMGIVKDR